MLKSNSTDKMLWNTLSFNKNWLENHIYLIYSSWELYMCKSFGGGKKEKNQWQPVSEHLSLYSNLRPIPLMQSRLRGLASLNGNLAVMLPLNRLFCFNHLAPQCDLMRHSKREACTGCFFPHWMTAPITSQLENSLGFQCV